MRHTAPKQKKPWLSTRVRIVLPTIAIGYLSGLGGCYGGSLLYHSIEEVTARYASGDVSIKQ